MVFLLFEIHILGRISDLLAWILIAQVMNKKALISMLISVFSCYENFFFVFFFTLPSLKIISISNFLHE